jgi:Spy/CpxP family protein refolding chaperone
MTRLMRGLFLAGGVLLAGAGPALAQQDTSMGYRAELMQQIQDRFAARVQEELGLTDAQTSKMRQTTTKWFGFRRDLDAQQRQLRQALANQLRPGIAANPDSATRYVSQLIDIKVRYAESFKQESGEMSAYLTPVQQAQYFMLRERLLDRIVEARAQRMQNRPPGARQGVP